MKKISYKKFSGLKDKLKSPGNTSKLKLWLYYNFFSKIQISKTKFTIFNKFKSCSYAPFIKFHKKVLQKNVKFKQKQFETEVFGLLCF